jgi:hypothetical protein
MYAIFFDPCPLPDWVLTICKEGQGDQWLEKHVGAEGNGKTAFTKANEEFERSKKENGYGNFTYDEKGELSGVAFKAPDVLIPADNEVR